MAITQNFRHARIELFVKNRKRRQLIGKSRKLHGAWVAEHNAWPHGTKEHSTWLAWKKSVQELHAVTQRINALNAYLKKGATGASLDIAKGIAVWEGGRGSDGLFHAYQDAVGVWTIGYGHTSADGAPIPGPGTRPLTGEQATILLLHDLNIMYAPATLAAYRRFNWKPNQKMFDAMVSFCYNLGPGYFFRGNGIGDAMSTRNVNLVARIMLDYDRAGGQVLEGLLRRRKWEAQLLKGGTYAVTN